MLLDLPLLVLILLGVLLLDPGLNQVGISAPTLGEKVEKVDEDFLLNKAYNCLLNPSRAQINTFSIN